LAHLRQVIERLGESRFTRWESAAAKIEEYGPRTIDRLGFRKTLEHGHGHGQNHAHHQHLNFYSAERWNRTATVRHRVCTGCLASVRNATTS
jgi:hypothetical protein